MSGRAAAILKAARKVENRKPWRRPDAIQAIRPGDFQQIAKESYEKRPNASLNDYDLARSTDTLKIYRKRGTNKYVVGVRGTADARDLIADAALSVGLLKYSKRYRRDKAELAKFVKEHPGAEIETTGHSLGGAVARQLGRDVPGIKGGAAFNSAITLDELLIPSRLEKANQTRYSTRNDFLRLLSRPFLKKPNQAKVVQGGADVRNPLEAHKLTHFDALNNNS
jgi:alpha-beta hydrolase superfamily lysophospholipase